MKLALISFTVQGGRLCGLLAERLAVKGFDCTPYFLSRQPAPAGLRQVESSLSQWTEKCFARCDGLIFVGACGIAVRAIAPWLAGKEKDPAVVVVDEGGRYAISLLSGHLGGGNDLTLAVAQSCGALPVVTTATDGRGVFSVDQWAARRGISLSGLKAAKAFSAALLEGKKVGFYSDFPVEGSLPAGVVEDPTLAVGMAVTWKRGYTPFTQTVALQPKCVVLGIGCRRGTGMEQIETAVDLALDRFEVSANCVYKICSIDLKGEEPGLISFAQKNSWPFVTFSAQELAQVAGQFTPSAFVKKTVGVDNVCERSAIQGSDGGKLLFPKFAHNGVTVAAALTPVALDFSDYLSTFPKG